MTRILIGAERVQTLALMASHLAASHLTRSGYDEMHMAHDAADLLDAVEALVSEKP